MDTNNTLPTFEQMPSILKGLMNEVKDLKKIITENPNKPDEDELKTGEEIRALLGNISEPTLWKYKKLGLNSYKIGNRVLFKKSEVLDFVKKYKVKK